MVVGWRFANAKGLDNSNLDTGDGNDSISINTNANSNGGWWWWGGGGNADSVGIDNNSSIITGAETTVHVNAFMSGANTNAWAIRDSSIDVGSGDDYVSLNAQPSKPTSLRPCLRIENSSIDLGSGNDRLNINANASGQGYPRIRCTRFLH